MATIGPKIVLGDCVKALRFLKSNPDLTLANITVADYERARDELFKSIETIAQLQDDLRGEMRRRDELVSWLNSLNSRIRSGARGQCGPDSIEYEELGGTRASKRKRYVRLAKGKR